MVASPHAGSTRGCLSGKLKHVPKAVLRALGQRPGPGPALVLGNACAQSLRRIFGGRAQGHAHGTRPPPTLPGVPQALTQVLARGPATMLQHRRGSGLGGRAANEAAVAEEAQPCDAIRECVGQHPLRGAARDLDHAAQRRRCVPEEEEDGATCACVHHSRVETCERLCVRVHLFPSLHERGCRDAVVGGVSRRRSRPVVFRRRTGGSSELLLELLDDSRVGGLGGRRCRARARVGGLEQAPQPLDPQLQVPATRRKTTRGSRQCCVRACVRACVRVCVRVRVCVCVCVCACGWGGSS